MLRRRPARTAGTVVAVAISVALLASLGTFFSSSKARMTERAIAGIPVDWQVQLAPGADVAAAEKTIQAAKGVRTTAAISFANTTGLRVVSAGTEQTTGPGKVLGVPDGYASTFSGEIRYLIGAHTGVLLAQQTAANLHAAVGTQVQIGRPGATPITVTVDGIVDLPQADSLFQVVGASHGSAPNAPPDNVVLLPLQRWRAEFAHIAGTATQIHISLSRALPTDPGAAFTSVTSRAKNLEVQLAGAGTVGNNIAVLLDGARKDAIYAQLLFLFLGIPGVILAAILAAAVIASGRDRRRRDQALLRIRGARMNTIMKFAASEAIVSAVLGIAAGLGGAILASRLAFGPHAFQANGAATFTWFIIAAIVGLMLALITIVGPAWRDAREMTAAHARAHIGKRAQPIWMRVYLDLILLAGAGLAYWQTVKSGYSVVIAPEGIPTISVSYQSFLAPLLLWPGAALLAWRVSRGILSHGRKLIEHSLKPVAGPLSGLVAASLSRQRRHLARGIVAIALAGSFAISTSLFDSTYIAQSRVDAQLTNGADVSLSTTATAGLDPALESRVKAVPGVAAVEPMQHRFAYVGNDLQDLYGIDPANVGRATTISDAFIQGGRARDVLSKLAAEPDGILVSDETVKDFQLQPGDTVRLRLQFASDHAYHAIPFRYIGIAREWPTAPHDSFLIANAAYVGSKTGTTAPQVLLVRTTGSPPAVAESIRRDVPLAQGTTVGDVDTELKATLSGLTALDLSGLSRLELAFAFLLAAAAAGLLLWLALAERQRMFAIAQALGARSRHLASFVWGEATFVVAGGIIAGIMTGYALAFILVKTLTGVFDPPPEHLSVPWMSLGTMGISTLVAVVIAAVASLRATRRSAVNMVRDL